MARPSPRRQRTRLEGSLFDESTPKRPKLDREEGFRQPASAAPGASRRGCLQQTPPRRPNPRPHHTFGDRRRPFWDYSNRF